MLLARCPSQSRYRFSEYAEDRKRSSGPPYPRPAQTPRPPGHLPPTTGVRERAGRPRSPRGLSYSISQRRSLLPARSREDQTCRRREQAGRKKKKVLRNRGPRKFVGERGWEGRWCRQQPTPSWHLDRLDSEVSLARSGNAVSRKWRKSRRKRDRRVRSKSRPDVSGRGASNAPSAFYPNSSLRGLTVCVPGGERPRRPPPGNPRSRQAGDWPVGVGF